MGLIRNHYVGRTFIEPEQAIRDFGVKLKLNPVRSCWKASAWSWWTIPSCAAPPAARLCASYGRPGATEVHVRISCPPTISPCYYGVDTPTREELIASHNSRRANPRILGRRFAGVSLASVACVPSVDDTEGKFCTACYTGSYPTELVQLEVEAHREG